MRFLVFVTFILSGPAFASDACHDLWFTRNLIFDRVGFCFASPLGQAVFDNGDCSTRTPVLSAEQTATITRIKEREAWFECAVDTADTELLLDMPALRMSLQTLPVLDTYESACIGWRGPVLPLFSGVAEGARQIAEVRPGDMLLFEYEYRDPFSFVSVLRDNQVVGIGWGLVPNGEDICSDWAG
ncbi:MAG: DUF4453 domain-containing protein [Silicimonas sp.]|nr:DUF4453 domain-containing protein [Silicimonas sp.]